MSTKKSRTWADYWEDDQFVYISPRYMALHYKAIERGVTSLLRARFGFFEVRLLDWGAGYAVNTQNWLEDGFKVFLYEPSAKMREAWGKDIAGAEVVTDYEQGEYDAILACSVIQYIPKGEMQKIFETFYKILRTGGALYIADVVPTDDSLIREVVALLWMGARNGFFFAAFFSLAKSFFSDYLNIKAKQGFSTYTEQELSAILQEAGFATRRVANITLLKDRMAFEAVK